MAKDGTNRGGARVGAGRKPKALVDKIAQGGTGPVLSFPKSADFNGEDVPPVKDFLKASQKNGVELCAEDVFKSTYLWLKERGCDIFVNPQKVRQADIMELYNNLKNFIDNLRKKYGLPTSEEM